MDASNLNIDLESIANWAKLNHININFDKLELLRISRSRSKIDFQYKLNDTYIYPRQEVRDLGVYYDQDFSFHYYIDYCTNKAFRTLGFIMRTTRDFSDANCIVYLFKTLVLPTLTYCSPIWSPYRDNQMKKLESVQHKFMRYLAYKNGTPLSPIDHNYHQISVSFNLPTIKSLHKVNDFIFAWKIDKNLINSDVLSKMFLERKVPNNIRSIRPLKEDILSKDYTYNNTLPRLKRLWNSLDPHLKEIRELSHFKTAIKKSYLSYY